MFHRTNIFCSESISFVYLKIECDQVKQTLKYVHSYLYLSFLIKTRFLNLLPNQAWDVELGQDNQH